MTLSFFRRHRKMFMVLMFLSLISMLLWGSWQYVEQRLNAMFGPGGARTEAGTIAGKPVTYSDLEEFYRSVRIAVLSDLTWRIDLNSKGQPAEMRQRMFGFYLQIMAMRFPWVGMAATERMNPNQAMVWLALYREAGQRGFAVGTQEVETYLKTLQEMGLPPEAIQQAVDRQAGGQRSRLVEALRTELTLRNYVQWLGETLGGATEPELRRVFAQMDERIDVRLAVLNAADFLGDVKDVPEDALQQQYNQFKPFLPGTGPQGYGYRIPDRVSIEYLVAEPDDFRDEAKAKITDEMVKRYYESAKDTEFLVKEETPAADAKKDDAKPPEKKSRPFEEVREDIRKKLTDSQAGLLARERLQANVMEIRAAKRGIGLGMWADGNQVRSVSAKGLFTLAQLEKLEGIGKATRGQVAMPAEAVALVELIGIKGAKLSVNEMSEPLVAPNGVAYAFRVTACEKSREPTALAEVREAVLDDVRRAKAFDLAREKGRTILEAAAQKGLAPACEAAKVPVVTTGLFTREQPIPSAPPEVSGNRVLASECFRMPAENKQRTLVTLAEDKRVVLAELVSRKAPREAGFERDRAQLANQFGSQVARGVLGQALDPESIRRRMTVVLTIPESERGSDGGEPEDTGF